MDEIRKRTIREWAEQGILDYVINNILETIEETEVEDIDEIKSELIVK
tara:strand:+ start:1155 stop:1298 length:144 start_codon:yes stop_codon:yes gene_type:complete